MKSNNVSLDDLPSPDQLQTSSVPAENLPTPQSLGYTPPQAPGSDLEDVARGAAQGLTLNSADEIQGAIQAARHLDLKNLVENKSDELNKLKKLYRQYQKASEQEYLNSAKRSPYLYGAGQIAGVIAPAVLTGGTEALAAGGAKAASSGLASSLPSILEAGAKGAAIGATAGAMGSEGGIIGATPQEQQQLTSEASQGAIAGGALGGAGAAIGNLASKASTGIQNYISKLAEEKPFICNTTSLMFF